jgi:hypothetical protein
MVQDQAVEEGGKAKSSMGMVKIFEQGLGLYIIEGQLYSHLHLQTSDYLCSISCSVGCVIFCHIFEHNFHLLFHFIWIKKTEFTGDVSFLFSFFNLLLILFVIFRYSIFLFLYLFTFVFTNILSYGLSWKA